MSKASPSIQSVLTILINSNSNVGELENRLEEKPTITRKMRDSVQRRRKPQKRTVACFERVHVERLFAEMDVNKSLVPVQSTGAYMMKTPFQQPCTMYEVLWVISQIMTAAITHFHFQMECQSSKQLRTPIPGRATWTCCFWIYGQTSRCGDRVRRKIVKPPVERRYRGSPSVSEWGRPIIRTP